MILKDIETILTYLQVTSHTRPFLFSCYEKMGHQKPHHHSYNNAERFIYGLNHGKEYWTTAKNTPLSVQPLLYYYGLTHYLRSCLLTVDPGYPATAKVLAHGLSTRKRKKQHYKFLEDDIRIQPKGLFPHAAKHLFGFNSSIQKVSMDELLRPMEDMSSIYQLKQVNPKQPNHSWPPLLAHLAVLYNLSMLVRYEGDWWGEMQQLRDREDYVFIVQYLNSSSIQVPLLVAQWLKDQYTRVHSPHTDL